MASGLKVSLLLATVLSAVLSPRQIAQATLALLDLTGLDRHAPWTEEPWWCSGSRSFVGIPYGGFVGKLLLFGATMGSGFVWLAVMAIPNSVLSLAVYLSVVVPMYQTPK